MNRLSHCSAVSHVSLLDSEEVEPKCFGGSLADCQVDKYWKDLFRKAEAISAVFAGTVVPSQVRQKEKLCMDAFHIPGVRHCKFVFRAGFILFMFTAIREVLLQVLERLKWANDTLDHVGNPKAVSLT